MDVHNDFFNENRVTPSLVYIKNLPEMQEKELLDMVLTWFGMVWVGNPFVIGVELLYQESWSDHGEIQTGTMAVRFASVGLAEHFLKLFFLQS